MPHHPFHRNAYDGSMFTRAWKTYAFLAAGAVAFAPACSSTDNGADADPQVGDDAGADGVATAADAEPTADSAPAGDAGVDASVPPGGLTSDQKKKAEMLTSIWENSTTVLQYPYSENIGDGRGYTSGRAGFCTGTGDAILVVRCFDASTGSVNPMHKYMPALTVLETDFNNTGTDQASTTGLDAVGSWVTDWASSANGATAAAFKTCQDTVVDQLYYGPAVAQAAKWGFHTALTTAALYDAEINHGEDGVAALIASANTDVGNTAQTPPTAPVALAAESTWLDKFLLRRLATLKADPTWAQSEDRAATYEALRTQANWDLSLAIVTDAKAKTLYPGKGYKDSGYPICTISPAAVVSGDPLCTSPTGQ